MTVRKLWLLLVATALIVSGCSRDQEDEVTWADSVPTPDAASPASSAAGTPTDRQTTEVMDVVIDPNPTDDPLMPPAGNISVNAIKSADDMVPGLTASGFFGDYVLENDMIKVIVAKPGKRLNKIDAGGRIIDLVHKRFMRDHLGMLDTASDLETTGSEVVYDRVDQSFVAENTTATLVMKGFLARREDPATTAPPVPLEDTTALTTYTLGKDSHIIEIETGITNNTKDMLTLRPGDAIDWGDFSSIMETVGMIPAHVEGPANWVIGTSHDTSVGYVTASEDPMHGLYSQDFAIVRAFGHGTFESLLGMKPATDAAVPSVAPTPAPAPLPGPPPTLSQLHATETDYAPPVETTYSPGVETQYQGAAVPETTYTPVVSPLETVPVALDAVTTSAAVLDLSRAKSAPGGGGPDDATTTAPFSGGILELKPGDTFSWKRYLVVSDKSLHRITSFAYGVKEKPLVTISGGVVERDTNRPAGGAEVRVAGGPNWSGQPPAPPFTRKFARPNGTFSVAVPPGRYVLHAASVNQAPSGQTRVLEIQHNTRPKMVVLPVTLPSALRVGVSEAETPTSSPLPSKVTVLAKPGTGSVEWDVGDITDGTANVYYMPRGGAQLSLAPGRYQIIISRGNEYEVHAQDIELNPGTVQEVLVALPHVVRTPGAISADIGVVTTGSAVGNLSPHEVAIMAACEGVSVVVSGDVDKLTNLAPAIRDLNLNRWVKSMSGMRFFVGAEEPSANILVYPVDEATAAKLKTFKTKHEADPADLFLADLRREFPDLIIQIDDPVHPAWGYLKSFEFDEFQRKFVDGIVPPPDFDAIQVMAGKSMRGYDAAWPRYYQLAMQRTQVPGGAPPLTPIGGSRLALTYGQEAGFPRAYLLTQRDTLDRFTEDDLRSAVRNQRLTVTNGPYLDVRLIEPLSGAATKLPGDVVDLQTTQILSIDPKVYAPSWIGLSNVHFNWDGVPAKLNSIRPHTAVLRYPVRENFEYWVTYPVRDRIAEFIAFNPQTSLAPIVSPLPEEMGGAVSPFAFTGPFYIDKDGDGRVVTGAGEGAAAP